MRNITVTLKIPQLTEALEIFRQILQVSTTTLTEVRTMSVELTAALDRLDASLTSATARIQEDVAALQAEIEELKNRDTITPEEMARLAELQARVDAIDPVKPVVLPTE